MARDLNTAATKTWTYWLPSIDGEGYAWIVLDSNGRFATISDWGNYAYWWGNWGDDDGDFRDFVRANLCRDKSYTIGKLGQDRGQIFKLKETKDKLREELLKERHPDDSEELEALNACSNEHEVLRWIEDSEELEDAREYWVTDYHPQLYMFAEKILPRLKALLDTEREAELLHASPAGPIVPSR